MKWKAKNDTCGVPGKGFIKAESFTQEDENALLARAKRRGIDPHSFMLGAGFVPLKVQVEMFEEEEEIEEAPKRVRRTKAQIQAEK